MILYPAIDLKDGVCVRLKLGNMADATVYNNNPAQQALSFQQLGFEWLHVVDLDGAFAGRSVNSKAIEEILSATKIPMQLGGGLRNLAQIEYWLDRGVARVILGTVALRDSALVKDACRKFAGKIAVGIDARNGQVAVAGWAEQSTINVFELVEKFVDAGVAAIIYTDIERDGILTGVNWHATLELARRTAIPVIASGGLASMDDILIMTTPEASTLNGAVIGRALYDGRLNAKQALAFIKQAKATVQ